jgi:predicted DNA-binding mobile mystery protein A
MLPKMSAAVASWPKARMGWIRLIRRALWMSPSELARALGVAQSSLTRLEQSEIHGTISLHSLKRAAEVLGCEVVYAFVPRQPLEEMVREQAMSVLEQAGHNQRAAKRVAAGQLSQKSADRIMESRIRQLLREPKFWSRG